ncbi:hypothetical protein RCH16_002706 [Cryobacterium sp. MP_M5]|nr:hypothetical protein [Cryobacterium sp. MP_M5]
MREWLSPRPPAVLFLEVHGSVMIGKNVKDRPLMAMLSKGGCCSS